MTVSRELLWRAWPRGYLLRRGVFTVGGWTCTYISDSLSSWTFARWGGQPGGTLHFDSDITKRPYKSFGELPVSGQELHRGGAMLPDVDPADVATWESCKADLAQAMGWPLGALRWMPVSEVPVSEVPTSEAGDCWYLIADLRGHRFDGLNTLDPAEALVRARIQLREKESQ